MARHETASKILYQAFCWLLVFSLCSCATYSSRIATPRHHFESGLYDSAIAELIKLAEAKDNDQLLYLMDLGRVYHAVGRYADAIKTFSEAEKIAKLEEYVSVATEVGTVILNDTVKAYKGEDFEKVMIHVYLAMDYSLIGKSEDALVECRLINRALDKMISQGNKTYDHNAFAKYLAASLFESKYELNDAFVDYRTLAKWGSEFPYLPAPLLRTALKLQATQEYDEYRKQFNFQGNPRLGKKNGEVILLLETGKSPIKVPSYAFRLVPMFQRRSYDIDYGELHDSTGKFSARSYVLYDIEDAAIKELEANIAAITAKKMAGVAAKEAVAYSVEAGTKERFWGDITRLFLHASDQADLRSWTTLPAKLQLIRMELPEGVYTLQLDQVNVGGAKFPNVKQWEKVEVKPGKIQFINGYLQG